MRKRDLAERTFAFATQIVTLCRSLDRREAAGRVLVSQLLRSGTSVGANVEEAQASQSRADFLSKSSIARKEARETHYRLRLMSATSIVPEAEARGLLDECNQLIAILTTIVKKLRSTPK